MTNVAARRVTVVGAPLDPVGMDETVDRVFAWAAQPAAKVAVGVNANVCNLATEDPAFAELLSRSDLAYADGQSVVWAAGYLGTTVPERVATTDLIEPIAERAAREGTRLFFLGAADGVAEAAAERLRARYPGLLVATHHGYVTDADDDAVMADIAAFDTGILFVGLGDPRQQEWVARNRAALPVGAVLTCGGLFDWLSGNNKRAPKWMISAGLEWLWRLIIEPRRLASRYLRGNPLFIARLLRQRRRARRS